MSWRTDYVRPRSGRVIAGVCAAIADRHGTSRTGVRVLFAVSVLLPGPQFVAYLLGWALFPKEAQRLPGPSGR